ncbi:MAG TPA: cytochrome c oxidase assembly protein [Anaerolineae bacterium]
MVAIFKRLWLWSAAGLLAVLVFIAAFTVVQRSGQPQSPAEVAQAYFLADYTHDYPTAWQFISAGDKAFKTREQYLAEHPVPSDTQAELLQQLAAWGTFSTLSTFSSSPEQTVVSAQLSYPDRTQPEMVALLEAAGQPDADAQSLRTQLQNLYETGRLELITDEATLFNLTQDDDGWRVVLHWDGAVTVHLTAAVHPDLPWEFYPLEPEIQAIPGETARTSYFARNTSDQTITGKAVHEILPLEHRSYLETIQCFCFTEQTLGPGEEKEMPLIFRVDFTVPQGVTEFTNSYTFYTLETFPETGAGQ